MFLFLVINTGNVTEEKKRQDVNERVSHLSTHECGGVSYSPALHDSGFLLCLIRGFNWLFPFHCFSSIAGKLLQDF